MIRVHELIERLQQHKQDTIVKLVDEDGTVYDFDHHIWDRAPYEPFGPVHLADELEDSPPEIFLGTFMSGDDDLALPPRRPFF